MTLKDLRKDTRDFLLAEDVAAVLGRSAQLIRSQAQTDPSKLGFPVIVIGTRVQIPREGFLAFCTGRVS